MKNKPEAEIPQELPGIPAVVGGDAGGQVSVDAELAAGLRGVIHRLVKVLRKETRNDEMLSLTERSTLALIYRHGALLPSELAQMEKVTTQSISQVVNRLSELNYISKRIDEADKRKVLLTLTQSGKEYVERSWADKQEWLTRTIRESLTDAEKQTLTEALAVLTRLADK